MREVGKLDNESKDLKKELFRICWYMRGSVSMTEAYGLSYEDRVIIADLIKDNLETTKETKLPFF
jgi:hypothetical protein